MNWLLQWNHLVYLIPLGVAVLIVFGSMFGLADMDGDAEADVDGDGHFDHDHDGPSDHPAFKALGVFGFGRVPLAIFFLIIMLLFGITGLAFEALLDAVPGHTFICLGAAIAAVLFGTPVLARFVGRVMPTTETYSVKNIDLIGHLARSRYPAENEITTAMTRDHEGNVHQVRVRITGKISKGGQIALTGYDDTTSTFTGEIVSSGQG